MPRATRMSPSEAELSLRPTPKSSKNSTRIVSWDSMAFLSCGAGAVGRPRTAEELGRSGVDFRVLRRNFRETFSLDEATLASTLTCVTAVHIMNSVSCGPAGTHECPAHPCSARVSHPDKLG